MIKVALVYDFDGTLAPGDMQEYGYLEAIGYPDAKVFWKHCADLAVANDAGGILMSQGELLHEALRHGVRPTRELFRHYGESVAFFPGVRTWFKQINDYGRSIGLDVQHFVVSSGIKEIIEGTPIADEFEQIYACTYLYNEQGEAYWPAISVDYSSKVQFLSKISKGVREAGDSVRVNQYVPNEERAIPFERIIYLGDGQTDIPSMHVVRESRGQSIAVYSNEEKLQLAKTLIEEGRVNYACPADYTEQGRLQQVVKHILEGIALRAVE